MVYDRISLHNISQRKSNEALELLTVMGACKHAGEENVTSTKGACVSKLPNTAKEVEVCFFHSVSTPV